MPRSSAAFAVSALLLCAAAPALADPAPDAGKVRQAAEQFDAGVTAYKQKDYEGAASRFEAADAAVPSAKALRQAIRARMEAGQGSRAATLAALAAERYPTDEPTAKLARETIDKVEPLVHKLLVSCASPCVLALGTRSVPGEANTRWIVYVDPGKTSLAASFFGGASGGQQDVAAEAGGSTELRFDPEEKKPPKPKPRPVADPPPPKDTPDAPPPKDAPPPETPKKGIPPAVFIVGLVATAGLGGTTIWSGIDTKNNPGADAVKQQCAGQGETCALYQEGRSKQTRTNILIGATAGTAAVTLVLGIFTRWGGSKKASDPAVQPTALVLDRGAALGAGGTF